MSAFAARLLAWHAQHGRHDLPWQRNADAYRIWVSEIMLQQTQVATVAGYFDRFVARFPSVAALAAAPLDDVLALWSGLGYYARARNLHRAAGIVVEQYGGRMPEDVDALVALPGIGRSTAGAILALAHGKRWPILDGNVKRVLVRRYAIDRWPGEPAVERELWAHSEALTPVSDVAAYTQAIMDLGATVCTRAQPACHRCPVAADCAARAAGLERRLPVPRPKRHRPLRRRRALLLDDGSGHVLLERRPEAGIWGGLYSLPELDDGETPDGWCRARLGSGAAECGIHARIAHAFTHFDLELTVESAAARPPAGAVMDAPGLVWYKPGPDASVGMPAPISSLLAAYAGAGQLRTA